MTEVVEPAFIEALQAAFTEPFADDRIQAVKQVVTHQLQVSDRHIEIKWTDYFNHSLAPDMVLRWPRDSRERQLFLRLSAPVSWLIQDLKLVGSERPILLSLSEPQPDPQHEAGSERLVEEALASQSLVTDPSALAEITKPRREDPIVEILSQAVIQGGKGYVQHADAERASAVTSQGFAAAEALDAPATKVATDLMDQLLEPSQAGRMTRMLQAVCEGHGGSLTGFPGRPDFAGPLTDDDVVYLLETIEAEGPDFWRSVGRTLTLAQVARLHLEDPSTGLQRLVAANLDRLIAKAVRVRSDLPMAELKTPRWLVSHGCLALRGSDWTAYIAPTKVEELPESEKRDGYEVQALRRRTRARKLDVGNVQLRKGDVAITYESTGNTNVVNDQDLTQLANSATIVKATVSMVGGRRLICDFSTTTAHGHTRAVFGVAELLTTALPIFMTLEDEEAAAVTQLLTTPDGQTVLPDVDEVMPAEDEAESDQPPLFEQDSEGDTEAVDLDM